jgi:hypothetical protein
MINEEKTIKGWVIITEAHPRSGNPLVMWGSFKATRSEAIKWFVSDSGNSWRFWKRNYGYKAVKAESTISINQPI